MTEKLDIEKKYDVEFEVVSEKDQEFVDYYKKRFTAMDEKRNSEVPKRQIWEENVKSPIYESQDGKAQVNMSIEQSLKEMRVGLIPETLAYRIVPNGKAEVDILEPAKYVLDFFVDKENVMREIRKRDFDMCDYGTGILYSGLWCETKIFNEAEGEGGFYNDEYKQTKRNIRHIGVKNVKIRDFWIDEMADAIEDAMDCIYQENMIVEDLRLRFLNDKGNPIKGFKYVKSVGVDTSEMTGYKEGDVVTDRKVCLRHYYNKLNGRYAIIANDKRPIYIGNMTMKHGELPFAVAQEYQKQGFYGIGIPEKCKSTKPYINNFFKAALDRTWKGSAIMTIGVSTDGELWDDPSVTAHRNFTGQGQVIPYEPNRDVGPNISMIEQMELRNVKNTGISVDPNFVLQAKTAFQTGVFKEEQNARLKPGTDQRNQAIDRALTIMLANISQFAPYLYADFTLDKGTKDIKDYEWLEIKIKNKKIKKRKGGKQEFEDRPGVRDFFELDDKLLIGGWLCSVRLETPSTTTNLKALEKAEFNELLTTIMNIASVQPEILKKFPIEDIVEKMELLYGFDAENLTARTTEKLARKKIGDLLEGVAQMGSGKSLSPDQLKNANMEENVQSAPGGVPTPEPGASQLPMGAGMTPGGEQATPQSPTGFEGAGQFPTQ